jgi:hypothetical protein
MIFFKKKKKILQVSSPRACTHFSPMHPTCLTHVTLLYLFSLIIFGEEYKLWIPSVCDFLLLPIISSFIGPNILRTLFSNSLYLPQCGWPISESVQNCGNLPQSNRPLPKRQSVSQSQSESHCDWQSVCLGVEPRPGLMTRYLFSLESYRPVHMGRPLWREVGSVICQS